MLGWACRLWQRLFAVRRDKIFIKQPGRLILVFKEVEQIGKQKKPQVHMQIHSRHPLEHLFSRSVYLLLSDWLELGRGTASKVWTHSLFTRSAPRYDRITDDVTFWSKTPVPDEGFRRIMQSWDQMCITSQTPTFRRCRKPLMKPTLRPEGDFFFFFYRPLYLLLTLPYKYTYVKSLPQESLRCAWNRAANEVPPKAADGASKRKWHSGHKTGTVNTRTLPQSSRRCLPGTQAHNADVMMPAASRRK